MSMKYIQPLNEAKVDYEDKYHEITLWDRGLSRRPLGTINYGLLDWNRIDMTSTGLSDEDKAFYKMIGKNPFIKNITVDEYFRGKGYGKQLYDLMFKWLKKKGFKIVYSGRTRNSNLVDKIWNKVKSGVKTIPSENYGKIKIYFKKL